MRQVVEARDRGLVMLEDPEGSPIGAVVCVSAHLAAFSTVVEPALLRAGCTPDELRVLHVRHDRVGRSLRLLERMSSGEAAASGLDRQLMAEEVADLVRRAGRVEEELLERLGEEETERLGADYLRALQHGPTRPHPTSRHSRLLRRLNAWRDHALDVMDGRLVPLDRPVRPHVETGRERRGKMDRRHPA